MTLVLIVSPEIKNNGFCLTCIISCIFLIWTCNKGISFYWWIICFDQASQYPLSLFFASLSDFANLLTVLPSRKLDSDFGFFLLILWQASRRSVGILYPSLSKMTTTFSSKASAFTSLGIPIMYAHSCLEYCAFNQYWFSILTSLLDRRVLTCFVKDILACNLEKDSLYSRISTSTLLFTF